MVSLTVNWMASQYLKAFLMKSVVTLTNVIFKILSNETHQHLEDLHNSAKLKKLMMLTKARVHKIMHRQKIYDQDKSE